MIATKSTSKRRLTIFAVAVVLVGITAVATWLTMYVTSKHATGSFNVGPIYQLGTQDTHSEIPSLPVRLMIPKINVDAAVESMGVTPEGDMDSPDGPDNTGWYKAGPRPGGIGSAVIDGHFGWKNNKPAVFDKLHTLAKGDLIQTEDDKKKIFTFIVTEIRSYGPDDDATDVFRSTDNLAHLNLITCQGAWNKDLKSYATRLVVFADLRD